MRAPSVFPWLLAAAIVVAPWADARATEQQEIVDQATITVRKMLSDPKLGTLQRWMKRAKGALVIPSLIKGGFIFGAEGGTGVLLVLNAKGKWSYPAFYTVAGASFGFQAGIQDSEVIFVIMTDKGLTAMMEENFKLGADASIAMGPVAGTGIRGATTANLGADVYAYAVTSGVFGGFSFDGTAMVELDGWNEYYYGAVVTARQIVFEHRISNKAADRLRRAMDGKAGK